MVSRLTESATYRHGWTTPELDAILGDRARITSWLRILSALADAQADLGFIPRDAADAISAIAADDLDEDLIAQETRRTSHSTLGLIRGLQAALPEAAREHVYVGITVQDLTDTWFGIVMRDVAQVVRRDLLRVAAACLDLAWEHRATAMIGRTHGQAGAPITFGLKAATWADEAARNLDRIDEASARWSAAQLAGATGALGFFDGRGGELRARLSSALGLSDPGVSWTSTRDRIGEFGSVMAGVAASLARIGNEVYDLQRTEVAELREAPNPATVGSITMPHKRNPERSEHLDTLARVARAAAGVLLEGMTPSHERDGRAWKAEWWALPEVALAAGTSAALAADLVEGLVIDAEAMERNLRRGGTWASQQILAALSARCGKHRAQDLLQQALADRSGSQDTEDLVRIVARSCGVDVAEVRRWATEPDLRESLQMTDEVVSRLRGRIGPGA